jgi:MazG family protein
MPIPPDKSLPPFVRLVQLMKTLRAPGGCAWDAKQTHESLIPYLIEECYEVVDAIEEGQPEQLKEELGDLLVQFVFHGIVAEEKQSFEIDDAITAVVEKLIRRHPHVFGDLEKIATAGEVRQQWEKQKLSEKQSDGKQKRLLDGAPKSMPGLTQAFRLGEKAAGVGFDWPDAVSVTGKVQEELAELKAAIESGDTENQTEEIGDLLFVVCSLSRKLGINPEQALKGSLRKFRQRFTFIEESVIDSGQSWDEFTLEELESRWLEAKAVQSKAAQDKNNG